MKDKRFEDENFDDFDPRGGPYCGNFDDLIVDLSEIEEKLRKENWTCCCRGVECTGKGPRAAEILVKAINQIHQEICFPR